MSDVAGTILVSLDGSHLAERALPLAAWLAGATGGRVRLVHVIDDERLRDQPAELKTASERFAAYAGGLAKTNGLFDATTEVLAGDPASRLLEAAAECGFVVMATHGRGGFRAAIIGSVADKVVRGTPVPILVVPGTGRTEVPSADKPFVVGLDGSPEAERGLALARELAARTGAKVTLVRAFHIPPPAGVEFSYYPPDVLTSLQEAAEEYIRSVAKPGEGERLVQGDAATAILETAKEVDAGLVVLTSGGKGLAKRLAFGSVTDRVLHALERPLLVVPPKR
ncbi:MAG: hypothetical protein C0506_04740 [Anaerolinea sp.]|nr:hypothetical protein [Anaerolinea sp.]